MITANLPAFDQSVTSYSEAISRMGDIDGIEVMLNQVLVATYRRPETTSGGIIRPDSALSEDMWQGKVGIVLKVGKMAFLDDDKNKFQGQRVDPGDWVMYRVSDGFAAALGYAPNQRDKVHCRFLDDIHIVAKVADPEFVW